MQQKCSQRLTKYSENTAKTQLKYSLKGSKVPVRWSINETKMQLKCSSTLFSVWIAPKKNCVCLQSIGKILLNCRLSFFNRTPSIGRSRGSLSSKSLHVSLFTLSFVVFWPLFCLCRRIILLHFLSESKGVK